MKFRHKYICVQPRTKLVETNCKIASASSKPSLSPCFTMLILIAVFSNSHAENKSHLLFFFSCHPDKHTNHRQNNDRFWPSPYPPMLFLDQKKIEWGMGRGVTLFSLKKIILWRKTEQPFGPRLSHKFLSTN